MNVWKRNSSPKCFLAWAKVLALFLAFALVVTMVPSGATKAYAESRDSNKTTFSQEEESSGPDSNSDSNENNSSNNSSDNSAAEILDESSDTATSSDTQDSQTESNSDVNTNDSSQTEQLSTSSDEESINSSDEDSANSEDTELFSDTVLFDLKDLPLITFNQNARTEFCVDGLNEIYGNFNDAITSDDTKFQENLSSETDEENLTETTNSYEQFTTSTINLTSNVKNSKFIDCNYSYHLSDDKTGVYIDGFSYVNENDKKISNEEKTNPSRTLKTLYIPATIVPKLSKNSYYDNAKNPLKVLGISENAFKDVDFVEQVFIDAGKTGELSYVDYLDIKYNAFNNCICLENVGIARNATLGKCAFANCDQLKSVYFEKNVAKIQDQVFENCISLSWVFWGNVYINQFWNADSLGEEFYTFGSRVFSGCSSLEKVCIPESMKIVKNNAFSNCLGLRELVIGKKVEKVGNNLISFDNSSEESKISKVVILNENLNFDKNTFTFSEKNKSKLTDNSFHVYSTDGSMVMKQCYDFQLPFDSDPLIIADAINIYSQKSEGKEETVEVKNDTRTHKAITYEKGDGSKSMPYKISSFTDLRNFAAKVNSGQTDACAILACDIKTPSDSNGAPLTKNNWNDPIGMNQQWTGEFDGNNYSIVGLTQDNNVSESTINNYMWADIGVETGAAILTDGFILAFVTNPILGAFLAVGFDFAIAAGGFFLRNRWRWREHPCGFVYKSGDGYSIHNVDFTDVNFNAQNSNIGGLISESNGNGSIESVSLGGKVNASSSAKSTSYSGVVGKISSGSVDITECVNQVECNSTSYAERKAGGIVGSCNGNLSCTNCSNQKKVNGQGVGTAEILSDVICTVIFSSFDAVASYKMICEKNRIKAARKAEEYVEDPDADIPAKYFDAETPIAEVPTDITESNVRTLKSVEDDYSWTQKQALDEMHHEEIQKYDAEHPWAPDRDEYYKKVYDIQDNTNKTYRKKLDENWNELTDAEYIPINNSNSMFQSEAVRETFARRLRTKLKQDREAIEPIIDNINTNIRTLSTKKYKDSLEEIDDQIDGLASFSSQEKSSLRKLVDNDVPLLRERANRECMYGDIDQGWNQLARDKHKEDLVYANSGNEKAIWNDIMGDDSLQIWSIARADEGFNPSSRWANVLQSHNDVFEYGVTDLYKKHLNTAHSAAAEIGEQIKKLPWATKWDYTNTTGWDTSLFYNRIPVKSQNSKYEAWLDLNYDPNKHEVWPTLNIRNTGTDEIEAVGVIWKSGDYVYPNESVKSLLDEIGLGNTGFAKYFYDPEARNDFYALVLQELPMLAKKRIDFFNSDPGLPLSIQKLFTKYTQINNIWSGFSGSATDKVWDLYRYFYNSFPDCRSLIESQFMPMILSHAKYSTSVFWKWFGVRKGTTVLNGSRLIIRGLIQQKLRKANNGSTQNLGEVNVSTTETISNATNTSVAEEYKKILNTSNVSDSNDSVTKAIKDMLKDIPETAVSGGIVDQMTRRSSIMNSLDADAYLQSVKTQADDIANQYYSEEDKGFGTFSGIAGGVVGEINGQGTCSFVNCTERSTVIGGETSSGIVGEVNSSGRINFEKCSITNESLLAAVDTGKASSENSKPATGGLIGKINSTPFAEPTINCMGCHWGQTQQARGNSFSGGFIGKHNCGNITVDCCAMSSACYSKDQGYGGGLVGKSENPSAITLRNSYYDGLVMAGDTKNSGCISGSDDTNINMQNVWYYSNNDIFSGSNFAKSSSPYSSSCNSRDNCTCMTDTKMLQSGELCVKLNDGFKEGVFGQNLGLVPYLAKEKSANSGEEKEVVKWKSVPKSDRPVPFYGMPVYKYSETTHESNANTNSELDSNSSVNTTFSSDSVNSNETNNDNSGNNDNYKNNNAQTQEKYLNVPDASVLGKSMHFIDVECDEHSISKPEGRIYVNPDSTYKIQVMPIGSNSIKHVLLDNQEITNKLAYNETTGAFEYRIDKVTANHNVKVYTEHKNFEIKPEFKDDYYLIRNINELAWYKANYPTLIKDGQKANARLMENIDLVFWKDMTGKYWDGLGNELCPYKSNFDGNGFQILNVANVSLFGVTQDANIHDLKIIGVQNADASLVSRSACSLTLANIYATNLEGVFSGLVQRVSGNATISGCHVDNARLSANQNMRECGGIIGAIDNGKYTEVSLSKCDVNVKIDSVYEKSYLGGLIGHAINKHNGINIDKCNVNVDASYNGPKAYDNAAIGGLVGSAQYLDGNWECSCEGKITNCNITGSLKNNNASYCYGCGQGLKVNFDNMCINIPTIYGNTDILPKERENDGPSYVSDSGRIDHSIVNCDSRLPYFISTYLYPFRNQYADKDVFEWSTIWTSGENCRCERNISSNPDSYFNTGEATYNLNKNNCPEFVQKLDDPSLNVSSQPTLYLPYQANGPEYIIRFNGNGAAPTEKMNSVFAKHGEKLTLPKNIYIKKGYKFAGWATSEKGKAKYKDMGEFNVSDKSADKEITLYAVWVPEQEKVSEIEDNSSQIYEQSSVDEGSQDVDNDANTVYPGTVYKYNRESTGATYFSNLTDSNSYIVKPKSTDDNYYIDEIRVKSGNACTIPIRAKDGYNIKEVKYDLQYKTADGKPNIPESERKDIYPFLKINNNVATASFENVYDHGSLVIDVQTEVIGGVKPSGDGSDTSPYLINTREELLYIAQIVNSGQADLVNNGYMNVKICSNINLEGTGFPGIGTIWFPFKGVIHGEFKTPSNEDRCFTISGISNVLINYAQNATIKYLNCVGASAKNSIVVYSADNSKIENITTSGLVETASGSRYCGAIAAISKNDTQILSCTNTAIVQSTDTAADKPWIGGIAGNVVNGGTIQKCENDGMLVANKNDSQMGGIAGRTIRDKDVRIDSCVNYGCFSVEKCGGCCVGGIVGIYTDDKWPGDREDHTLFLTKCSNCASIEGSFHAAGGLVGSVKNEYTYSESYHSSIDITNCSNLGDISCTDYAGGFVGKIDGLDAIIDECNVSSANMITANNKGTYIGGHIQDTYLNIKNSQTYICQVVGVALCGSSSYGHLSRDGNEQIRTHDEFLSGSVCSALNSTSNNAFCQCIDRLDCKATNGPEPIVNEDQRKNFSINYIEKKFKDGHEEKLYSNYKSEELCWVNSTTNEIVESSNLSSHYPVGAEMNVGFSSKLGILIDTVTINDMSAGKSVFSLKAPNDSASITLNYKFSKAGDYELKTTVKLAESKVPSEDSGYYKVCEPKELLWISQKVNNLEALVKNTNDLNSNDDSSQDVSEISDDNEWDKINFCLGADINMRGIIFAPIGQGAEVSQIFRPFSGNFKGKGFTISNLDATLSGLSGGLFGYAKSATIDNCKLNNIKATGGALAYKWDNEDGESKISDVSVNDTSIITPYTETFTNSDTITCSYVGGLVGMVSANQWTIEKCTNNATINANCKSDYNLAGGIVGLCSWRYGAVIKDCINSGAISSIKHKPEKESQKVSTFAAAGGVVGATTVYNSDSVSPNVNICDCVNNNTVGGEDCSAGGILGSAMQKILSCSGEWATCNLISCEVYGHIGSSDNHVSSAGGFIGSIYHRGQNQNDNSSKACWSVSINTSLLKDSIVGSNSNNDTDITGGFVGDAETYVSLTIDSSYIFSSKISSWRPTSTSGLVVGRNCWKKDSGLPRNEFKCVNTYICDKIYQSDNIQGKTSQFDLKDKDGNPKENISIIKFSENQMKSGELCYKLTSVDFKRGYFTQNIDKDLDSIQKYPVTARRDSKYCVNYGLNMYGAETYTNFDGFSGECKGKGTLEDPYLIETPANMVWLKKNPDKLKDAYLKLVNDIDMSRATAFSSFDEATIKSFDGCGHTISGLKCSLYDNCYYAPEFKNIKFADCACDVAIVAKKVNTVNIENCIFTNCSVNYNDVYIYEKRNKKVAGGIIGVMCEGTINNCVADISIINNTPSTWKSSAIGSFVGLIDTYGQDKVKITNCTLGTEATKYKTQTCGFVGCVMGNAIFENCKNNSTISNSQAEGAAGFVTEMAYGCENIEFNNCENQGDIQAKNAAGFVAVVNEGGFMFTNCRNKAMTCGLEASAGFVAKVDSSHITIGQNVYYSFDSCSNQGWIIGNPDSKQGICGGFIANVNGVPQSNSKINFKKCVNSNQVGVKDKGVDYSGGFVGLVDIKEGFSLDSIIFKSSYNTSDILSNQYAGGFLGKVNSCKTINVSNTYYSGYKVEASGQNANTGMLVGMYSKKDNEGKLHLNNAYIADGPCTNFVENGYDCELTTEHVEKGITLEAFNSGEITFKLNNNIKDQDEMFFQVLDDLSGDIKMPEKYPSVFSDKIVYYGNLVSDPSKAVYTNFSDKVQTKPEGDGTNQSPFLVKNEGQLYYLTSNFNSGKLLKSNGEFFNNPYIKILNDLDMSKIPNFKGFGYECDYAFAGILDGCSTNSEGKENITSISHLNSPLFNALDGAVVLNLNLSDISIANYNVMDNFGCVASSVISSKINNVKLASGTVEIGSVASQSDKVAIGCMVGYVDSGSDISKCASCISMSVKCDNDKLSDMSVGGIIGKVVNSSTKQNKGFTIKDLWFDGNLQTESINSDYENYYAGGTVGCINVSSKQNFAIDGLYNTGNIKANNFNVGGVLGIFKWGSAPLIFDTSCSINQLQTEGNIFANNSTNEKTQNHNSFVGGIVAKIDIESLLHWNNKLTIDGSYYSGSIKVDGNSEYYAGGLIGGDDNEDFAQIGLNNSYSFAKLEGDKASTCGKLYGQKKDAKYNMDNSYVAMIDEKECTNPVVANGWEGIQSHSSEDYSEFSTSQFSNGAVTYYLNENKSDGLYLQTLDKHDVYIKSDAFPVTMYAENVYELNTSTSKDKYSNYQYKTEPSVESNKNTDENKEQTQAPVNTKSHIDFGSSYYGSVVVNGIVESHEHHGELNVEKGSKVVVQLKPGDGYVSDVVFINNDAIPALDNNVYEFIASEDNYEINAAFKEDLSFDVVTGAEGRQNYKLKDGKTFEPWTPTAQNPLPTTSGNYYLTADVNLTDTYTVAANVAISLSLDGHMVKQTKPNCAVINVAKGGSLEVYDLNNTKNIEYYFAQNKNAQGKTLGSWILKGSSATMAKPAGIDANMVISGGIITGANGTNACGLSIAEGGSAILHQGTIVGNNNSSTVGGVDNYGTLDDKHCTIQGNFGKLVGGVINHKGATFTSRYYIKDNFGQDYCGGILTSGTTNIEGLSTCDNNFVDEDTNPDPKVYAATSSDIMYNAKYIASYNPNTGEINPSTSINYIGACIVPGSVYIDFYIENAVKNTWFVLTKDFSVHMKNPQTRVNGLQQGCPAVSLRLNNAGEIVVYNR